MKNKAKKDWKKIADELLNVLNCSDFEELPIADDCSSR